MLFKKLVFDNFRQIQCGSLAVELPNGETLSFGGLNPELHVSIRVLDPEFFRRCVLFGPIGFAESYLLGHWDTPDLVALLRFFILNSESLTALQKPDHAHTGWFNLLNFYNRLIHQRRPNSIGQAKLNIQEHYDLSNEFFQLWLDPSMTYSSAVFDPADLSLEAAQTKKYDLLCQKLRLQPSDHLLEIGSGWGGMALHAANNYGCRVTSLTISEKQHAEASARVCAAGLQNLIEIRLQDYRLVEGQFDKVVSIEMIEAVGDQYLDSFFAKIASVLHPEGLAALQMITCPDQQFPILRDGVDFIQKHIFPGSLLVSPLRINQATARQTQLNLFDWEDFALHYARTLQTWRETFEARLPEVRALGFSELFLRKWRYYLAYCEAAFATRHISVVQMVLSFPNNHRLTSQVYPCTTL
jgi:cyclopropane-fatty-acyl-phospholipid synthase